MSHFGTMLRPLLANSFKVIFGEKKCCEKEIPKIFEKFQHFGALWRLEILNYSHYPKTVLLYQVKVN